MTDSEKTTATIEGPAWSAGASGWVDHWARFAAPAREAAARAAGLEAGASVLDVGCGSGEFCELAAARGAQVSGIDAASGLVEIARRRLPEADLRVGPIERLPWRDESFDLVTGFNAFQFAAHFVAALTEAGRVPWRGGRVAICNWGRIEDREVHAIFAPILHIGPEVAERVVRTTVEADGEPFRRSDGSYRFENRLRYLIAVVP
jgi:ubiquinone/menaquinone biosynthesis C-methylase UbiE